MATFRIDDLIRGTLALADLDADASVEELISELVEQRNLPRRTIRGRPIEYRLIHDEAAMKPDDTLRSGGVSDNDTVQLESPVARSTWARVQHLMSRIEADLKVEARRQKDQVIAAARDEVDAAINEMVTGQIAEPREPPEDAVDGLLHDITDEVLDEMQLRIDGITGRVLDEISSRLRGGRASISLPARVRSRRNLARLARTGLLGEQGGPLRRSVRRLTAMGLERTATATIVGAGAVAVLTVPCAADIGPCAPDVTTTTTMAVLARTVTLSPLDELINAGEQLDLSWAASGTPDAVEVVWDGPEGRISKGIDSLDKESEITLSSNSPRTINISVRALYGDTWVESDPVEVAVNQRPHILGPEDRDLEEDDGIELVPFEVRDVDGDRVELGFVGEHYGFELLPGLGGTHHIRVDASKLGPGAFGFCVLASDGNLEEAAWTNILVRPIIQPGDSLWAIALRMLEAEARAEAEATGAAPTEPTIPQINDLMHELRLGRWLDDPDLITTGDLVVAPNTVERLARRALACRASSSSET